LHWRFIALEAYCTGGLLHGRLIAREAYCTGGLLHGRLIAREAYCMGGLLHGRLIAREAYCMGGLLHGRLMTGITGCFWYGSIVGLGAYYQRQMTWGQFTQVQLTEVHFSAYGGHFVPDAFCPRGILREAFDWAIFDLEVFCSGDFCWDAFDRVLLTGGFLFGDF
jgi:hypothetical protein